MGLLRQRRRLIGGFLAALLVAAAVWRMLPAVRHAGGQLAHVPAPAWPWVAAAAAAITVSYGFSAVALQVAVGCRLPLRRTVLVQLVAAAVNRVTPGNVGGAAVNTRFLTRRGFTGGQAAAAVGACGLAHVLVAVLGVLVFGPAVAVTMSARIVNTASDGGLWIAATCFLAAAAAVILRVRHRHRSSAWAAGRAARLMTEAKAAARDLLRRPARLAALIVTVAAVKAANLLALYSALWAFDGDVASWRIAVVYLVGATTAEIVPTPSGLGTVDGALLAGLVGAGASGGAVLAAVIVYRLLSFWAPIVPGVLSSIVLRRRLAL